jgi:hypothetical protein
MKRNPKQVSYPEGYMATRSCLRIVEDRIELYQDCLKGKETVEKPLLLQHIKNARKRDEEMLETIDEEIADLKAQIKELEAQATKFRAEIKTS